MTKIDEEILWPELSQKYLQLEVKKKIKIAI